MELRSLWLPGRLVPPILKPLPLPAAMVTATLLKLRLPSSSQVTVGNWSDCFLTGSAASIR